MAQELLPLFFVLRSAAILSATSKKKSSLSFLERNPFKYDSSSSEDEAADEGERHSDSMAIDRASD